MIKNILEWSFDNIVSKRIQGLSAYRRSDSQGQNSCLMLQLQINLQSQDQTNCKQFYSFSSSVSFITHARLNPPQPPPPTPPPGGGRGYGLPSPLHRSHPPPPHRSLPSPWTQQVTRRTCPAPPAVRLTGLSQVAGSSNGDKYGLLIILLLLLIY